MFPYRVLIGAFAAGVVGGAVAAAGAVVVVAPGTFAAAGAVAPGVFARPGTGVGGVSLMPRGKRLSLMLRSVLPLAAAAEFAFCSAAAGLTFAAVLVVRPAEVLTSP